MFKRWKRLRKAEQDDFPQSGGKVPWYITLVRFLGAEPKEKN